MQTQASPVSEPSWGNGNARRCSKLLITYFKLRNFCSSILGVAGFWAAVAGGETLQSLVPRERWDADAMYSTDAEPGKSYARFGAFLQVISARGLVFSV